MENDCCLATRQEQKIIKRNTHKKCKSISNMFNERDPELLQYFSVAVSIVCAMTSLTAYYTDPKWRKRNYSYACQILVKCLATCCILTIFLVAEDMSEMAIVIYDFIVLTTVFWTFYTMLLGHMHVALGCKEILNEETIVSSFWYYTISGSLIVFYNVQCVLNLQVLDIEAVVGTLLLAIATGNFMLLLRIIRVMRENKLNIVLVFIVNVIGIICDVILIFYGFLIMYEYRIQLIYDVLIVMHTVLLSLQTILILCYKNGTGWNKYSSSHDDEVIGM